MKPNNDHTKSNAPVPRKRFRVQKLEERIAPTRTCKGWRRYTDPDCFTEWKC